MGEHCRAQTVSVGSYRRIPESVGKGESDKALLSDWERIFAIRDEVLKGTEEARVAKEIGSSLEAKVVLNGRPGTARFLLNAVLTTICDIFLSFRRWRSVRATHSPSKSIRRTAKSANAVGITRRVSANRKNTKASAKDASRLCRKSKNRRRLRLIFMKPV